MERKIITQLHDHPFIVNLYYAFQTEKKLYMVMDFLQGGEFFNLLYRRKMLSEEEAKFYMAEVLLGLEGLHSN
jgi:serine/threonine protein kinase